MCTYIIRKPSPSPLSTNHTLLANFPPPWRVYVFYGWPLIYCLLGLYRKYLSGRRQWYLKWNDCRKSLQKLPVEYKKSHYRQLTFSSGHLFWETNAYSRLNSRWHKGYLASLCQVNQLLKTLPFWPWNSCKLYRCCHWQKPKATWNSGVSSWIR